MSKCDVQSRHKTKKASCPAFLRKKDRGLSDCPQVYGVRELDCVPSAFKKKDKLTPQTSVPGSVVSSGRRGFAEIIEILSGEH